MSVSAELSSFVKEMNFIISFWSLVVWITPISSSLMPLWSKVLEPSRFIVTLPLTFSEEVKVGRRVIVPDGSVNLCRLRFGTSSMAMSTVGFLRKALNYVCGNVYER